MTLVDWLLVMVINGGIALYGFIAFRSRGGSFDWYLAAKSIPWWMVGLSAFSTAIDSGDYVAIAVVSVVVGNCGRLVRPEFFRHYPDVYLKLRFFSTMAPWHAPSSHLAKSAVSGHAQYIVTEYSPTLSGSNFVLVR